MFDGSEGQQLRWKFLFLGESFCFLFLIEREVRVEGVFFWESKRGESWEWRMNETWGKKKKRENKKKEINIILSRGGNKKHYLILSLSCSAHYP